MEQFQQVGLGHGRAAGGGSARFLPDVQEDAGAAPWLGRRVVVHHDAPAVLVAHAADAFAAGPVLLHRGIVHQLVVVAGIAVVHALQRLVGMDVGHPEFDLRGGGMAEDLAEAEDAGGGLAVALLLERLAGFWGRITAAPSQTSAAQAGLHGLSDGFPCFPFFFKSLEGGRGAGGSGAAYNDELCGT